MLHLNFKQQQDATSLLVLTKFSREKNSPAETVDLSQSAQESKQSFEKMLEVDEGQLVNAKDGVPGGCCEVISVGELVV